MCVRVCVRVLHALETDQKKRETEKRQSGFRLVFLHIKGCAQEG